MVTDVPGQEDRSNNRIRHASVGSPHGLPGEIGTDGESLVRSAVWQGSLDPHAYLAAPTVTRRAVEWNVALEEALRLEDVSVQIFADLQVQQVEPRRDRRLVVPTPLVGAETERSDD